MKKIFNISKVLFAAALLVAPMALTSCNDDNDDFNTNQYVAGVNLNSFGPSPVARGGELRFLGSGMDQITKVTIPGAGDITDIQVVSANEIRVTVPQTAEPGHVVLTHAGGTITTKTILTYLEPVSIEGLSPLTVKPGEKLTISGEYLNLMKEVIFTFTEGADSANVYAEAFAKHERPTIEVIVPENAISGPVAVSDAQAVPNVLWSEMEINVVIPAVDKPKDLTNAVPGSTVVIAGSDLDLVKKVIMPNGDEVEYTYNAEDGTISFVLPANVTDGAIVVETASLVRVAVANVGVVVPTQLVVEPASEIRPGSIVKVKGVNMDQVDNLTFTNVDQAIAPATVSATEITFAWPDMAWGGDFFLNCKSGKTVSAVANIAMVQPMGFNPDPINAGGAYTITGKNLDLLAAITYNDGTTIDVANDNPAECVTMCPAAATAGVVIFTMKNGQTVEVANVNISSPVSAYITSTITEEIKAGELLVVTIGNYDVLTDVKVDGTSVQFINNAGVLYISLPASTGKHAVVTLVSSNGQISYDYDVIPATHVSNVIWQGAWENAAWAGNQDLAWGGYDWSQVPAGAVLTITTTPTVGAGEWWCISLRHGNGWANIPTLPSQYDMPADGILEVVLTQEILTDLIDNGGMVITGQGYIMTKVEISWENSLEEAIWTGEFNSAGWAGNQDLAWGGYDWSTVKAGTVMRLYCTPTVAADAWWCISLRHGNGWANIPGLPSQYDTPADGLVEVVLTQDILDDLNGNGGLVITGDGYILTKVTLE